MTKRKEYFTSRQETFKRSEVQIATYNPRKMSEQAKAMLKHSMQRFGVVGGITVNKRTMTIVGGNQKVALLDELLGYPKNNYKILAVAVDCDKKTEEEMNIMLNSDNVKGEYDAEKMRTIIPDIDYKAAGLTEEDLTAFGFDIFASAESEVTLSKELDSLFSEYNKTPKKSSQEVRNDIEEKQVVANKKQEAEVKSLNNNKTKIAEKAVEAEIYVMVSFDNNKNKEQFLSIYGFLPTEKVIKGEKLIKHIEP